MIKVALGGRISEEIFFNRVTTGASDDFKKCAQYAHGMVTEYGMSPRLGPINYAVDENGLSKPYSEETNQIIDEEINRIISETYKASRELLESKKELIEKLAERLLEKETLSLPEIVEVLGERPFKMKDSLKDYLQELKDRDDQTDELKEKEREQEEQARKDLRAAITFDADAVEEEDDADMAVKIDKSPAKEEKSEKTDEKSESSDKKDDDEKKEK